MLLGITFWNQGLAVGSKYWEDTYTMACNISTQTLVDTRTDWPDPSRLSSTEDHYPSSVDGILPGPPTTFIPSPYTLQPTTTLHLFNRHPGPNGKGLGCGGVTVKKVIHLVSYQAKEVFLHAHHMKRVADIVSFFQFHASGAGREYLVYDYGCTGMKHMLNSMGTPRRHNYLQRSRF